MGLFMLQEIVIELWAWQDEVNRLTVYRPVAVAAAAADDEEEDAAAAPVLP